MKKINKLLLMLLSAILAVVACACSSADEENVESSVGSVGKSTEKDYDSAIEQLKNDEYEKLPESINEEFTSRDYSIIDTNVSDSALHDSSFSVKANGYAIVTPTGATEGYINGLSSEYAGTYTTSKHLGFECTREQIMEAYKVKSDNVYTVDASKLAFGFFTLDGSRYSALSADEVKKAIDSRYSETNPAKLLEYHTVAIWELSVDANGNFSEFALYQHCKDAKQDTLDH